MKTYKELMEDQWADLQKKINSSGEVYEVVANIVMLSKWGGIRKTVAPHIKVLIEGQKVYMMRYDLKKKQIPPKSIMESTDLKMWKKIISNKEVKKI